MTTLTKARNINGLNIELNRKSKVGYSEKTEVPYLTYTQKEEIAKCVEK